MLTIIYSDQMGVELGKVLAKNILAQLSKPEDVQGHDSSVSDYPPSQRSGLDFHTYYASLHIDDRPHPLLPEVQEGIINHGKSQQIVLKCATEKKGEIPCKNQ